MTTPHVHTWKIHEQDGAVFVIDTWPQQYPYVCECGAFTHDPDSGAPCQTCSPADYARRGPVVTLSGGPLNERKVARPGGKSILFQLGHNKLARYTRNEQQEDIWDFAGFSWATPFVPHEEDAG